MVKWGIGDLFPNSPNKGRVGYANFFYQKKKKKNEHYI